MIFDLSISLIQCALFAYFIGRFSKVRQLEAFVATVTFLHIVLNSFFLEYEIKGIVQLGSLIILSIIVLFLFKRKLSFNDIYALLLYEGIEILLTVATGVLSFYLLTDAFLITRVQQSLVVLGQLLLTYLLLNWQEFLVTRLEFKEWKIVLVNEIVVVLGICETGLMLDSQPTSIYYWILLLLCSVDFILSKYTIYRINQMNNEMISNQVKIEKELILENRIKLLNSIKDEVNTLDHRMFYIVHQANHLLGQNKIEETKQMLKQYEKSVLKYDSIIDTGNSAFDLAVGLMFYELKLSEMDFNNAISISVNEFYNQPKLISFLRNLLDVFSTSGYLNITILESQGIVSIKCYYKDCEFDLKLVIQMIEEYQKDLSFIYKITESLFSFVFDLEGVE